MVDFDKVKEDVRKFVLENDNLDYVYKDLFIDTTKIRLVKNTYRLCGRY